MSYKEDLRIDTTNLDGEMIKQPTLYMQYAQDEADAKQAADKAKAKLEIVEAKLSKEGRGERQEEVIEEFGKVTEKGLEAWIKLQPKYQEAQQEYIDAKHAANVLGAACEAFRQKRKMLERLLDGYIFEFFSAPQQSKKEVKPQTKERMKKARRKK